ncbi:dihydroneopterin aldolase [Granulicoccus phenolivorans]|uniref:dihydroneopterin aldolase n=1 Tax=Granulicoccus phenolivorans TaxID=266854 RepID=UPI000402B1AD|nr:dihydroneopterin aldolase [Granulicoccus phenolivorans]
MDRIRLTGVKAFGYHGVLDSERESGQDFYLDVCLGIDIADAAAGDDLTRTVDYAELSAALVADVAGDPVNLIETLAERLAATCLARPRVVEAEVTVHKPHAPVAVELSDISVTIVRHRAAEEGAAL